MKISWTYIIFLVIVAGSKPGYLISAASTPSQIEINPFQIFKDQKPELKPIKKLRIRLIKKVKENTDTLAGISLGSGILTAVFFILAQFIDVFGFISILTALFALGFGIGSLLRLKTNPEKKGRIMAITGLVLGGGWLLILGIVLLFFTGG